MANVRDIARGLWIVWAILAWNVVFDHVIVVAGREYIAAAIVAANTSSGYARMDDWMRPAITRGLWMATGSSALILLVGFVAIRHATKDENPAEAGSHVPRGERPHGEELQGQELHREDVKSGHSEGVA
jgi:hypothetical protein